MRISDWSSDVCSSDLAGDRIPALLDIGAVSLGIALRQAHNAIFEHRTLKVADAVERREFACGKLAHPCHYGDRKRVVQGKSGSVRVDLGGPRIIKEKNTHNHTLLQIDHHNYIH